MSVEGEPARPTGSSGSSASGPAGSTGSTGSTEPAWRRWPVGARVVVRRSLPEGGLGDVLGDLLEVGDDGVLVQTRRGPVRVDGADIVLGKRVPPPPPRRC